MSTANSIQFTLQSKDSEQHLTLQLDRLVIAGWVGKEQGKLQEHIQEMQNLGVAPPSRTPTYMNLTANLLTAAGEVEVISPATCGEVECVLLQLKQRFYLGLGSDHTDRELEKTDIPASKQVCPKPLAPVLWDYAEIQDHIDSLRLRSWMISGQDRFLYQEGVLGSNLGPEQLYQSMPERNGLAESNLCLFCGTFPTVSGIFYGDSFEIELEDPILDRRIRHSYSIQVLNQYL
jgi:hypothetical protein